jgi:Holliday junction resolvase RusA-like endonuclease
VSQVLQVWIPFLPPSSNKIYEPVWVQGKPRGKRLSKEGGKFKFRAMRVMQQDGRVAFLNLEEHVPYELTIAVFFKKIYNAGWPEKAKNKYEKVDATNRIKLIEDTVADAVGLDDRHNFRIIVEKHCEPDNPGIYVMLRRIPEEEVGLTRREYDAIRLQQPESDRVVRAGSAAWFNKRTSGHRTERSDLPQRGPR